MVNEEENSPPAPARVDVAAEGISRTSIRPPAFSSEYPALWFAQLEHQFQLYGITREFTKFSYAASFLDTRAAIEVEEIIRNPPHVTPYCKLRDTLIQCLSQSREAKLKQLLEKEELGDRKPSQFLRYLRTLDSTVPDSILRTVWLSRLPSTTQAILASQKDDSLDKVSETADRIHEVTPQSRLASVDTHSAIQMQMDNLRAQMSELMSVIKNQRPRSKSRQRSSSRSRPSQGNPDHCWYHQRYLIEARKCFQPCTFKRDAKKCIQPSTSQGNANSGR